MDKSEESSPRTLDNSTPSVARADAIIAELNENIRHHTSAESTKQNIIGNVIGFLP